MFKRIVQPGLVCIFDADHERPLKLWDKTIKNGQIKRNVSDDVKGLVLEMNSKMPMSCYINCPHSIKQTLSIQYPFFHMVVKLPVSTFFAFDVQVLDDKSIRRRLRVSTVQTFVDIHPFMCKLPLTLENGWNRVTLPLHYALKDIYGTAYLQTLRVAVYSNCILKKIYFSDKEYAEEDIPTEFHIEEPDLSENYRLKYTAMNNPLSFEDAMTPKDENKNLYFLLHSHHTKPLKLWDRRIRAGHISQILDQDLHCYVLEIVSMKSSRTYITCPADPKKVLAIPAPFLHFTVKNLHRSLVIDVLIRDHKRVERRFRAMTKQKETQLKPYTCKMPLSLESGWNQVVLPLKEYTYKAYGTIYVETLRIQMHATCRIQRIYFSHNYQTIEELTKT